VFGRVITGLDATTSLRTRSSGTTASWCAATEAAYCSNVFRPSRTASEPVTSRSIAAPSPGSGSQFSGRSTMPSADILSLAMILRINSPLGSTH
jgi:hypothetical protein